jgi:hypothetical protein
MIRVILQQKPLCIEQSDGKWVSEIDRGSMGVPAFLAE